MTIEIANRLCAYRKYHGFSQEQLAEKIGVSRQAVSKWERAEASPDTDNLILLSEIYGVTLDDLLNTDPGEAEDTVQDEVLSEDRVSFNKGINVHAKNGDKVSIGFSGVHVDTHEGEHVHVGFDGIHVEENGHVCVHTDEDGNIIAEESPFLKRWNRFPWGALCCAAYLIMGFYNILGGWGCGWMIFLTIPLYHSLGKAVANHNPRHFAYPVLTALIYLYLGLIHGRWHPSWILFLTIPVYYAFCNFLTGTDDCK